MVDVNRIFGWANNYVGEYYLPEYATVYFEHSVLESILDNRALSLLGDHVWPRLCLMATLKRESFMHPVAGEQVVFIDAGYTELVYAGSSVFNAAEWQGAGTRPDVRVALRTGPGAGLR